MTNEIIFCTYFDKNYLPKGLSLISSFFRYHPGANLWVLCFDDYTQRTLEKLKITGLKTVSLAEFEKGDKELLAAKKTRHRIEYYWTCTPSLPLYLFYKNRGAKKVVYLDADLYFYSSLEPVLRELGEKSILVVEHRFPPSQQGRLLRSGRFNVAVLVFNRDKEALACLSRWRRQCLAWCYQRLEDGKYGDQLYLNEWPKLYPNLVISQNLGLDAAPWNIGQYKISVKNDKIFLNTDELICFHFHELEILRENKFNRSTGYLISTSIGQIIYQPYEEELKRQIKILKKLDSDFKIISPIKSMGIQVRERFIKLFGPLFWRLS